MAMKPWSEALWLKHGPRGGDEINIRRRENYGWPLATHGINYSGLPIPEARAKRFREPSLPVCLAGLSRGERDGLLRGADLSPVAA
jgi:glucose/arabinose dehydrogenase